MLRIVTNDGRVFTGESASEVVRAMADAQWNAPERKVEYKREVVNRVRQITGASMSDAALRSPARFLRFLQAHRFVRIEADVPPVS